MTTTITTTPSPAKKKRRIGRWGWTLIIFALAIVTSQTQTMEIWAQRMPAVHATVLAGFGWVALQLHLPKNNVVDFLRSFGNAVFATLLVKAVMEPRALDVALRHSDVAIFLAEAVAIGVWYKYTQVA